MSSTKTAAKKRDQRFHGAFTGGFSAGFYNSVGSSEGWTPSNFSSSRDQRATPREQRPEDFMDDEDGLLTEQLQAKQEFDTLGLTAGEIARKHALKEGTGGAIPGPAPSELIIPVGDPMGKKLLRTMGWREGQGVGSRVRRKRSRQVPGDESPEERLPEHARGALGKRAKLLVDTEGLTFAPRNTDVKARSMVAKTNLYGVGHEPFKDAPEFGASRASRDTMVKRRSVYSTRDLAEDAPNADGAGGTLTAASMDRGSHGFVLDDEEDDVYEVDPGKEAYDDVLDPAGGKMSTREGLSGTARAWAQTEADGDEEVLRSFRQVARCPSDGRLPPAGFVVAQRPDDVRKHWAPPLPPPDFDPVIHFEVEAPNPLRVPSLQAQPGSGLDAARRARLLEEPRLQSNDASADAKVLSNQHLAHLPEGSSALAFLSPAARKKLLDAAKGGGGAGGTSPSVMATANTTGNGKTTASRSGDVASTKRLDSQNPGEKGIHFNLASKFTSGAPRTALGDEGSVLAVGGVDPSSRPAGLSVRTPTAAGNGGGSSSALVTEGKMRSAALARNPSRSTRAWRPAPLLCKRLNVPVPKSALGTGWAAEGGATSAGGAPEQDLVGPRGKFVSTSSATNLPKTPLLKNLEEWHPISSGPAASAGVLSLAEDVVPVERPPIDLFKSIFESESESESDDSGEDNGETSLTFPAAAGQAHAVVAASSKADLRAVSEVQADNARLSGIDRGNSIGITVHHGREREIFEDERVAGDGGRRERGRKGSISSGDVQEGGEVSDDSTTRGSRDTGRKRSGSKHKRKHKKEKSERKHHKHEHKRKKSRSSKKAHR